MRVVGSFSDVFLHLFSFVCFVQRFCYRLRRRASPDGNAGQRRMALTVMRVLMCLDGSYGYVGVTPLHGVTVGRLRSPSTPEKNCGSAARKYGFGAWLKPCVPPLWRGQPVQLRNAAGDAAVPYAGGLRVEFVVVP